jgi:purine-binding chemotaxis protein CheW
MAAILDRQYLTFSVAGEQYALPVGRVREVLEYSRVTKLPGQVAYLKGLIDLRGRGVPVLDMRMRLGFPEAGTTEGSAIIVAELGIGASMKVVGLLADEVHKVVEVDPGAIDPPPRFSARATEAFLQGLARGEAGFVLILDADRILGAEELDTIGKDAIPNEELKEA